MGEGNLNSVTCPNKEGRLRGGCVGTEAEVKCCCCEPRNQRIAITSRSRHRGLGQFLRRALRGSVALLTPFFGISASRTVREDVSVVFSP